MTFPDGWDLYQAKHYEQRLTPGNAYPELVKFFGHLLAKSFPVPRKYYFCAPKNVGPELHDLLANDRLPEVEIIGSVEIGQYCSKACRDHARDDLLLRENVHATYPGIGPIEPCSRCGKPVDMTKFHLTYVESILEQEWECMSANVLESTVLSSVIAAALHWNKPKAFEEQAPT